MRILYISNHFSLPNLPGAPRPFKVASYLQSCGNTVTVITNRRHYLDETIEVDMRREVARRSTDGIRDHWCTNDHGPQENTAAPGHELCRLHGHVLCFRHHHTQAARGYHRDASTVRADRRPSGWVVAPRAKSTRDSGPLPRDRCRTWQAQEQLGRVCLGMDQNFIRRRYDHIVAVVPDVGEAF